ncbi:MAG: hypothetical protein AAFU78_17400 [Cyanobacteria bacterium J06633_2]
MGEISFDPRREAELFLSQFRSDQHEEIVAEIVDLALIDLDKFIADIGGSSFVPVEKYDEVKEAKDILVSSIDKLLAGLCKTFPMSSDQELLDFRIRLQHIKDL